MQNNEFRRCQKCGDMVHVDYFHVTYGDEWLCEDCYEEYIEETIYDGCAGCGTSYLDCQMPMQRIETNWYCAKCYTESPE